MGSDFNFLHLFGRHRISIHAPRVGSDRGALPRCRQGLSISIHAPRVGSDAVRGVLVPLRIISIHAPRVGSDIIFFCVSGGRLISIHAPRVGSDPLSRSRSSHRSQFQSTLPVWGATSGGSCRRSKNLDFNPRSPCGERHKNIKKLKEETMDFNPRSPCGERQQTCTNTSLRQLHYTPKLQKKATDFCL